MSEQITDISAETSVKEEASEGTALSGDSVLQKIAEQSHALDGGEQADEESRATVNPFIAAEESAPYKKMEREFNDYRRKKVLSRIDSLCVGNPVPGDIREEFRRTTANARARAVVMPWLVPQAKKELPEVVRVEAIVDYPYVCGSKRAVLAEIKAALRQRASVCAGVNLSSFASGNRRHAERMLKTYGRLSRRRPVTPMFSVGALNAEQLTRLANLVKTNGFTSVKLILDDDNCSVAHTADAVKIFYDVLGERCPVEVVGKINTPKQAEELFSAGADRLVTTDYKTLSRQKLDGLTV